MHFRMRAQRKRKRSRHSLLNALLYLSKEETYIMGIIDKVSDLVIGGITKKETIRLPYEELTKIVTEEFITGADDAYLAKVIKTAKGGFIINKDMKSQNERYDFHVGIRGRGLPWFTGKPVWIFDNEANKYYQLDKDKKWKKFYKAIGVAVKMEKINRNR